MKFTIDLLQGKGLPQKSRPGTIALAAIPFLVPLLATGLMAGQWYYKQSLIATEQAILEQNQQYIQKHKEELELYESTQEQILGARHEIKNIQEALEFEVSLSPLLLELVETLPDEIFVTRLDFEYQPLRRKAVNPANNMTVYQRVIRRTLRMILAGPNQIETDQAVDAYIQTLRSSPALSQVAEKIQITSRQETEIDKKILLVYEIKCPLIEQIQKMNP